MEKEKKKRVRDDHYRVLGLPSGKEGTKLNERAIIKAFRAKALQLHPDKRPNDPNANAKFQRLQASYAILMDPNARKKFDAYLVKLDNKSSSDEPRRKTSSEPRRKNCDESDDEEKEDHKNELFVWGYLVFVLGPMIFPAGRTQVGFVIRGLTFMFTIEELHNRQQLEKVWEMVVRARNYFKRNPPNAATNHGSESQEDDHEDIEEDWVMV